MYNHSGTPVSEHPSVVKWHMADCTTDGTQLLTEIMNIPCKVCRKECGEMEMCLEGVMESEVT